jgi:propanediol dehydratase small subunit
MATKKQNSHTSTRKKASASLSTSPRAKKAASKTSKSARKYKLAKKKAEELARQKRLKKLEQLTLKIFRWAYESNQRGEFQRL